MHFNLITNPENPVKTNVYFDQEDCADLITPLDGATNVSVDQIITWTPETGFGYTITIGTAQGSANIFAAGSAFGDEMIQPPLGLPENTDIFVDIDVRISDSNPDALLDCEGQQFRTGFITELPDCTSISFPQNGATDIFLNPNFGWEYAPRATSYRLIITNLQTGAVVFDENVGNTLSFTLNDPQLEQNTQYNVVVIPRVDAAMISGEAQGCSSTTISFTTANIDTSPPECTQLVSPSDGNTNVALTPVLEWEEVQGADGYLLTGIEIRDNGDTEVIFDQFRVTGQTNTSTVVFDFLADVEICVTVQPFRLITAFNPPQESIAFACQEICFTTAQGCGPFIDEETGEIVDLNPSFEGLEDTYFFCENDGPLQLEFTGNGTEFTWIQILENSTPPISGDRTVIIQDPGLYRIEVLDVVNVVGGTLDCEASFEFTVTSSELATIENVRVFNQGQNFQVVLEVSGIGDYEFSLGSKDGPYQDSNIFDNVSLGDNTTIYVRDRNGCGIVSTSFGQQIGFPKFFTPNGDSFNDFWQVRGVMVDGETVTQLQIFDRFGDLLIQFDPFTLGWDGTLNGRELPSGGYWYRALTQSDFVFTGHFALKR